MRNILFLSDNFSLGGLETHLLTYFKSLKNRGFRIYFLTHFPYASKRSHDLNLFVDKLFEISHVDYSANSIIRFYSETKKIIEHYNIDVVHLHPFISLYGGFLAAFEKQIPVIVTLHGRLSLFSPEDTSGFFLENVILNNSLLFSVNKGLYSEIKDVYSNIYYLPNPIDTSVFKPCKRKEREEKFVLLVSRLDDDKFEGMKSTLTVLCELSEKLNFGIKVVGDGRKKGELKNRFSKYGVEFLGAKSPQDVARYMCMAKAVGGMGRVVLEALFVKRPVFLIGYDNLKGFLTKEMFFKARATNFNGTNIENFDPYRFESVLKEVLYSAQEECADLFEMVYNEYSSDKIVDRYIELVCKYKKAYESISKRNYSLYRKILVIYKDFIETKKELENIKESFNNENSKLRKLLQEKEELLNQAFRDKERLLESFSEERQKLLKEKDEIYSKLVNSIDELNKIYNSKAWKAISLYYKSKTKAKTIMSFFARKSLESIDVDKQRSHSRGAKELEYFKNYLKSPVKDEVERIREIVENSEFVGIVLYPLSYPLHMKQRPEHILRILSKAGFLCLILSFEPVEDGIRKEDTNLFITDMIGAVVYLLHRKKVGLYITFHRFVYFTELFEKAFLIYDVLDEPELMNDFSETSLESHKFLMKKADLCLFSSDNLYDKYSRYATNPLLLPNGVNLNDFDLSLVQDGSAISVIAKGENEVVVGYYGVVSELIDYDILKSILTIKNVRLVLIGPKSCFMDEHKLELEKKFQELLKFENFSYIPFVPYEKLKEYLSCFDICVIPFVVNEITNSVSPLKLFEYMAAGKPVVCTPTSELLKYKDYIYIADGADRFRKTIENIIQGKGVAKKDYSEILEKHDWGRITRPLVEELRAALRSDIYAIEESTDHGRFRTAEVVSKTVDILNVNFFDWEGKTPYYGGAERYVLDVAKLIERSGWKVRIVQNSNFYFEKNYKGFKVIGIPAKSGWDYNKLYAYYLKKFRHSYYTICSPLDIACRKTGNKVIGINHGIYWDDTFGSGSVIGRHRKVLNALQNVDYGISVDTNFINWVRTYDYKLSEKLIYIPNYFDPEQFKPHEKSFDNQDIVVLYPRRLYKPRGIYLVFDVIENIVLNHPNVKFKFVGQSDSEEKRKVDLLIDKYPENVEHTIFSIDDMHLAYQDSQIVIIPTVHSEGTSLACIEAMATNNAIIATNVGGLPNLIIDGYNGLLIHPNKNELERALLWLVERPEKRRELAENALKVSVAFKKDRWERKWMEIIKEFLT